MPKLKLFTSLSRKPVLRRVITAINQSIESKHRKRRVSTLSCTALVQIVSPEFCHFLSSRATSFLAMRLKRVSGRDLINASVDQRNAITLSGKVGIKPVDERGANSEDNVARSARTPPSRFSYRYHPCRDR